MADKSKVPEPIEGTDIPDKFDPGRIYDVQLHTGFEIGHTVMAPGKAQTIKGDVCELHRDKIWKATLNEWGIQEA